MKRNILLVSLLVFAVTFSGCLSIFNKLEKIVVSADNDTIKQGESVNLSAKGFGKNNKEIPLSKLQWKLNDETLGELETDGSKAVFTANENAEGKVKITVSQGKVSDSIEITIEKADEEPEPEPVNREQLEQLINEAETLLDETTVGDEPGQVSEADYTALQSALDNANAVNENEEATQEQVDEAANLLSAAIASFKEAIIPEPDPVNKDALITAVNEAEELLENTPSGIYKGQAPVHAHAELEAAVNAATVVVDDDEAAQEDVDEAVTALEAAISKFNSEIVTAEDPLKVHTFTIDSSYSGAFTTDGKGAIEYNTDPAYIKSGTTSLKHTIIGNPSPFRVRVAHPNWITDWREYDHITLWFYVENTEGLNRDYAFIFQYPDGTERKTLKRSAFQNGWNELVFNLRDDLGLTNEQLADMNLYFQFILRNADGEISVYIDEIRLIQLEEVIIVDKTALESAITEAEALKSGTPVGSEPGHAPEAAHTALQAAIDEAKGVLNDPEADQDTIDSAVVAINTAVAEFIEAIIKEDSTLIISEDFTGLTSIDDFWKASYKSLPGDPDQPMYKLTGGKITLENGMLVLDGARFTIGMPSDRAETTDADTDAGGTFDLSKSYKITVEYDTVSGELSKKFQIYIDNNTTSAGKSIHHSKGSTASRPYSVSLEALPENGVIEVTPNVGTENSFIQLRVESSAIIKIKSFKVEYL